jgi:hypothetical protein
MSGTDAVRTGARKRVLILSYYWPPAGGPGVQRFLKFSRYLREYGWEPVVITPENGSYPNLDPSLEADVPEGMEVIRTGTLEPFALYNRLSGKKGKEVSVAMTGFKDNNSPVQRLAKWVRANAFIPDARVGWKRYAVAAAHKRIKAGGIDAVITTGPPHSTHLAGLALRRKAPGGRPLPWLADMRDPWTTVYYNAFFPRTARTKRVDRALEDRVLREADQTVVISPGMEREFAGRAKALKVIVNGFDEEDLYTGERTASEHFRLCYIGNMKPNQQLPVLWQALAQCRQEDPAFARDFRMHFTGSLDSSVAGLIREAGLEDALIVDGFVQHTEATKRMALAPMLLFPIPESPDNERILTGKIFEYLASGNRMLSIGPENGDAARLLAEAGKPPMLDYRDRAGMVRELKQAHADWLNTGRKPLHDPGGDYFRFSRRSLTGSLARVLDQLVLDQSV